MVKVLGYCRVSHHEQAQTGLSLDSQEERIRAYCDRNKLELIEVVREVGSGKEIEGRKHLESILERLEIREAEGIVTTQLDRLSRRLLHVLKLIDHWGTQKITYHAVDENIDTSTPTGMFIINMRACLAQLERERTSERLKLIKATGQHMGRYPFGWKGIKGQKELVPNEDHLKTIEIIKAYRGTMEFNRNGDEVPMSYKKICEKLTEQGRLNGNGKVHWSPQLLVKILKKFP